MVDGDKGGIDYGGRDGCLLDEVEEDGLHIGGEGAITFWSQYGENITINLRVKLISTPFGAW